MAIKDITRQAVMAAISEYDQVGQDAFLGRYGFERARLYVLVYDGKAYDSKAIVGAAHGYLPGEAPLTARQFSGGEATVGRLLRRLGFTVQVGEELTGDRLERLLARLQVYRSDGVPALYQPITLLWAFWRAHLGEPRLVSWQETQQQLGALFQRYGRGTEGDRVYYPIAALHGAGLWELDADPEQVPSAHGNSIPQRWFDDHQPEGGLVRPVYDLIHESPKALAAGERARADFLRRGRPDALAQPTRPGGARKRQPTRNELPGTSRRIPAPMHGSRRLLAGPREPEGRQGLICAHPLRRCPARCLAPQRRPLREPRLHR